MHTRRTVWHRDRYIFFTVFFFFPFYIYFFSTSFASWFYLRRFFFIHCMRLMRALSHIDAIPSTQIYLLVRSPRFFFFFSVSSPICTLHFDGMYKIQFISCAANNRYSDTTFIYGHILFGYAEWVYANRNHSYDCGRSTLKKKRNRKKKKWKFQKYVIFEKLTPFQRACTHIFSILLMTIGRVCLFNHRVNTIKGSYDGSDYGWPEKNFVIVWFHYYFSEGGVCMRNVSYIGRWIFFFIYISYGNASIYFAFDHCHIRSTIQFHFSIFHILCQINYLCSK